MQQRKLVGESVGTFALVFLAVGTAVVGITTHGPDFVALAFGAVLVFGVYSIGSVSGCRINPAVTVAMLVARKRPVAEAGGYWITQVLGATVAAANLKLMVSSFGVIDQTGGLGTNDYGGNINAGGAFVVETILTLLFVLVILLVTDRRRTRRWRVSRSVRRSRSCTSSAFR